jgi:hypothetical protein
MLAGGAELHAQPARSTFRLRMTDTRSFPTLQDFLEVEVEKDVFLMAAEFCGNSDPPPRINGTSQRSVSSSGGRLPGWQAASTSPVIRGDLDKIRPRLMARLECEGEFKRASWD